MFNGKIIFRKPVHIQNFRCSTAMVIELHTLLHEEDEDEENEIC